MSFPYYVVEFTETPDGNKYVCVPNSWIYCEGGDLAMVKYALAPGLLDSGTNKNDQLQTLRWTVLEARVKSGADSYEHGKIIIMLLKIQDDPSIPPLNLGVLQQDKDEINQTKTPIPASDSESNQSDEELNIFHKSQPNRLETSSLNPEEKPNILYNSQPIAPVPKSEQRMADSIFLNSPDSESKHSSEYSDILSSSDSDSNYSDSDILSSSDSESNNSMVHSAIPVSNQPKSPLYKSSQQIEDSYILNSSDSKSNQIMEDTNILNTPDSDLNQPEVLSPNSESIKPIRDPYVVAPMNTDQEITSIVDENSVKRMCSLSLKHQLREKKSNTNENYKELYLKGEILEEPTASSSFSDSESNQSDEKLNILHKSQPIAPVHKFRQHIEDSNIKTSDSESNQSYISLFNSKESYLDSEILKELTASSSFSGFMKGFKERSQKQRKMCEDAKHEAIAMCSWLTKTFSQAQKYSDKSDGNTTATVMEEDDYGIEIVEDKSVDVTLIADDTSMEEDTEMTEIKDAVERETVKQTLHKQPEENTIIMKIPIKFNTKVYKSGFVPKKDKKPPPFDDEDSKWTLRYQRSRPGLVDIGEGSGIYVDGEKLETEKKIARGSRNFARWLFMETFSDAALKTCSLAGRRVNRFIKPKPKLNTHARNILIDFIINTAREKKWDILSKVTINTLFRNLLMAARTCPGLGYILRARGLKLCKGSKLA